MPPQPSGNRPLHAYELTPNDAAAMALLSTATFGPNASVVLPSGRKVDGAEMSRWASGNAAQIVVDRRTRPVPYPSQDGRFLMPILEHQPTAVIPVTPAQPQPITNGEPYNDHPWCRKRLVAIAVIFGAGMVVGALIATIRWWFG